MSAKMFIRIKVQPDADLQYNGELCNIYHPEIQRQYRCYSVQFIKFARRIAVHQRQYRELRLQRRRTEVKRNTPDGDSRDCDPDDERDAAADTGKHPGDYIHRLLRECDL